MSGKVSEVAKTYKETINKHLEKVILNKLTMWRNQNNMVFATLCCCEKG